MHATTPRSTYENQNRELRVMHDSKSPTLRINDIYARRDTWARMRNELDRSGSASSKTCRAGVQGASRGGSELGMTANERTSGARKEETRVSEGPPSADAFAARDHTRERNEEERKKEGEWVAWALRLTRIVIVRSITGS
jgi:hypothetical protein